MISQCWILLHLFYFIILQSLLVTSENSLLDDLLQPYLIRHGSTRNIRSLPDSESKHTYEIFPANVTSQLVPASNTRYFVSDVQVDEWPYTKVTAYGHVTTITNPLRTFSVLEPLHEGGCAGNIRETVEITAKQRNCLAAQNGGFFNTTTGGCLGNIVSDGRSVHSAGDLMNANFGITKDGFIVVGYLSQDDIDNLLFQQLIEGAVWLVRNGSSYVDQAMIYETSEIEETGTLSTFINIQSARTAIGHDTLGRVVLVHVDGQSSARGVNLRQFASLLINEFHLVNAINLDGGGSATLVLNGTLSNYPSDHCKSDPEWRCARSITTVVCAHEPDCVPECQHGNCTGGRCECLPNYQGEDCDELFCGKHNCSGHGFCFPEGCNCLPGWRGRDCSIPCGRGRYGKDCLQECRCVNNGSCDSVSGSCDCGPGFGGLLCERVCEPGKYGQNCQHECHCSETCMCDPVNGLCGNWTSASNSSLVKVAQCLAEKTLKQIAQDESEKEEESFYWSAVVCTVVSVLALSLVTNVYLMLIHSGCLAYKNADELEHEYIQLDDMTVNQSPERRSLQRLDNAYVSQTNARQTRPFSMKRTRLKSQFPAFNKLMNKFELTRNKRSRGGYAPLDAPQDEDELDSSSVISQTR